MRGRRDLQLGIATIGIAVLALSGCSGTTSGSSTGASVDPGVGPITFASGKDLTGAMPQLIAKWNQL
ncbi:MAG: hypothetical protein M0Z51_15400, partial [Propionibacterium sp.]|nr:hypothetical protein [Propionibacterium sp.]